MCVLNKKLRCCHLKSGNIAMYLKTLLLPVTETVIKTYLRLLEEN